MYALIVDGSVEKYPYSVDQLRRDNPGTSFPKAPDAAVLAEWGVVPVVPTPEPSYDPNTQRLEWGVPVKQKARNPDGTFKADDPATPENEAWEWVHVWNIIDLSAEEIQDRLDQRRASATLSPAMFRLNLLAIGELDNVEAAIPLAPREVQIMWEYSSSFERTHPALAALAAQLGYTDEQLDALFGIA